MTTEVGSETAASQAQKRRSATQAGAGVLILGLSVAAMAIASAAVSGPIRYLVAAAIYAALGGPVLIAAFRAGGRQAAVAEADYRAALELSHRHLFETRLANALEMTEERAEVVEVIERSFAEVLPLTDVELLLADEDDGRMFRIASAESDRSAAGCGVESADLCPAARRAQLQVFPNSDDIDACPKLRQRSEGALSAVCVPVSFKGRSAGVIHGVSRPNTSLKDAQIQDLLTMARLVAARAGQLRVTGPLPESAIDELTGLMSRTAFEAKLAEIRVKRTPLTLAMADLDHLQELNGTHGRDIGDKALSLFARVLRDSLRSDDLICRFGGEEFAIAFPACAAADAQRAIDAIRSRLDAAITVGGLPNFTVSFGVTDAELQEELSSGLQRADEALQVAKRRGRDRVVLCDAEGRAIPEDNSGTGEIRL